MIGADRPLRQADASGDVVGVRRARILIAGVLIACGSSAEEVPNPPALTHADYDCRAEPVAIRDGVRPGCLLDPSCDRQLVVGHRGAGGNFGVYAPENSYSAIRFAILIGADAVEVDVRHTLDDRLVVMHDPSLERTTGVERNVNQMPLSEVVAIPLLQDGLLGNFDCEVVPTFAEVLAFAKNRIDLVVDTKTNRGDLVARAIADAGMLDQASVSVSNVETAVLARGAVQDVSIQLRPDTVDEYESMSAMFTRPAEIMEIPEDVVRDFVPIRARENNRIFVDVFTNDAMVFGDGNTGAYGPPYDAGADALQSEFPAWVLMHLGRDFWASLPAPRDLGLDSPLLRD